MIETKNIELSTHAFERIQERFPAVSKNKRTATDYIRGLLKSSEYIGILPDKCGRDAHMYVYNNSIAIHTNIDTHLVATVYEIERDNREHIPFRDKIKDIYKKEFRKLHRFEFSRRKKLELAKAKNEAEVAALKYKKVRTRSENVRKECDDKIANLEYEILLMTNEIKDAQIAKKNIAYAIATNNF
ncbi:UNVERIFIED_CONTAM: hypothetical protein ABIC26_002586 [Paenibacillus sp. PvR008]